MQAAKSVTFPINQFWTLATLKAGSGAAQLMPAIASDDRPIEHGEQPTELLDITNLQRSSTLALFESLVMLGVEVG
ncbi:MAG: hypothetical protein EA001_12015 [Oscillatoriales cyanobacterium]|nr:MAG: hypothetical protein EA001_12015 [Oscillatoriales cyanobacterium]